MQVVSRRVSRAFCAELMREEPKLKWSWWVIFRASVVPVQPHAELKAWLHTGHRLSRPAALNNVALITPTLRLKGQTSNGLLATSVQQGPWLHTFSSHTFFSSLSTILLSLLHILMLSLRGVWALASFRCSSASFSVYSALKTGQKIRFL